MAGPPRLALAAVAIIILVAVGAAYLVFFKRGSGVGPPPLPGYLEGVEKIIEVSSPVFSEGSRIPARYTCDGEDVSPPLRVEGVPEGAESLVVVVYDPDAPRGWFTHWILYDVPATVNEVPEAVPPEPLVEGLGAQGVNDFGRLGYGGPCPPRGLGAHRYVVLVIALDTPSLNLPPGAALEDVETAMAGRIIGYGYTYFTYSR
ncbi:MAG: YbhB/YbcL family Raf kinase inhibitor-like protein [Desulfurococcales archaeon]|nr:YbhB/YbcL family Raf kinase inhibitor-like protein [Desulfurococcales archaeon]